MGSLWNRLTQSLVSAGAMNARRPLVAWEASWEETEALLASDKQRARPGRQSRSRRARSGQLRWPSAASCPACICRPGS